MIPGEMQAAAGDIELNVGRKTVSLAVTNSGDRPIQVGSHYHFFETNEALKFDRKKARGYRLNIAAGTAVRFEPGQSRTVQLVALAVKTVAVPTTWVAQVAAVIQVQMQHIMVQVVAAQPPAWCADSSAAKRADIPCSTPCPPCSSST